MGVWEGMGVGEGVLSERYVHEIACADAERAGRLLQAYCKPAAVQARQIRLAA